MNPNKGPELMIQRILVALDASPHSLAALEIAVDLAARFHAELLGLYVEDINVLRLAEFPFAREIGLFSGKSRQMETQDIEGQIKAQMARARQIFDGITARASMQASFHVARGGVGTEIIEAALDADVLILGRAGWSPDTRTRLGSTARAALCQSPGLTLVVQEGTHLNMPVLVVYDGSLLAQRALAITTALLRHEDTPLTLLLLTDNIKHAQRLQAQADTWVRAQGLVASYRLLVESNVSKLAHIAQIEGCGIVVMPSNMPLLQDEALLKLLEAIKVPVLLVR